VSKIRFGKDLNLSLLGIVSDIVCVQTMRFVAFSVMYFNQLDLPVRPRTTSSMMQIR